MTYRERVQEEITEKILRYKIKAKEHTLKMAYYDYMGRAKGILEVAYEYHLIDFDTYEALERNLAT